MQTLSACRRPHLHLAGAARHDRIAGETKGERANWMTMTAPADRRRDGQRTGGAIRRFQAHERSYRTSETTHSEAANKQNAESFVSGES